MAVHLQDQIESVPYPVGSSPDPDGADLGFLREIVYLCETSNVSEEVAHHCIAMMQARLVMANRAFDTVTIAQMLDKQKHREEQELLKQKLDAETQLKEELERRVHNLTKANDEANASIVDFKRMLTEKTAELGGEQAEVRRLEGLMRRTGTDTLAEKYKKLEKVHEKLKKKNKMTQNK